MEGTPGTAVIFDTHTSVRHICIIDRYQAQTLFLLYQLCQPNLSTPFLVVAADGVLKAKLLFC